MRTRTRRLNRNPHLAGLTTDEGTTLSGTLVLAVTSLALTLGYLALFVDLHVLPTGYDPIRHAVSDYGVGRYSYLFRISLWDSSLAVLALTFALMVGLGSPAVATRDFIYFLLIPVARIGMTLFPTDVEGGQLTRTGIWHYVFAVAAFTFTYLAISETTGALRDLPIAAWLDTSLRWTAWLVAPELALVVLTMIRPLRRVFGLFERLFLVTTNVWFLLVSLALIDSVK